MMNDSTESNDLDNQTEQKEVVEETTKALPETEESDESGDLAATSETEESEEADDDKPKKAKGYKGKWLRTQAELQKLALEVEMLKGANKPVEKPAEKLEKPKRDDFDSVEEFTEALTDFKLKVYQNELKAESEKTKHTQSLQSKQQAHNERLNSFVKEAKDFNDVVESFIEEHGDVQFSKDLNTLIVESDLGPQAIYELVKNKDLLDKLNSMGTLDAAKEFGKLEDKILAKKTTTTTKTKASAPITPLKGGSATVKKDIYDPNLSYPEWEKLMNERDKQRKRA